MIKKWQFQILLLITLLCLSTLSYAKTADEYLGSVYKLINQKQYDEALLLVQKGADEYPGNLGLTIAFAEIHHLKGDYETAIANYVNIMKALVSAGEEVPEMARYHHNLVDAYNELGQRHYFPKELCLRIIYHAEKVFELMPEISQDSEYIEFERKSIGHYDVASIESGNVMMLEKGGDGADFQLPEDYVTNDEKMRYKDKALQRIKEYDALHKGSTFRTSASDKTVDEILQLIDQKVAAIKSIHFKRVSVRGEPNELFEEIIYKAPHSFKVIESNAIGVIKNGDYYIIDPQTNKVLQQDRLEPTKVSLLKGIGFYNLSEALEAYNLSIDKIDGCPDFLSEVCKATSINLYLITATVKDKDKGFYPPTSKKIEYLIDSQTGLCLAKKDYWLGILGSGKEEELALEYIVTEIGQTAEGIPFASLGIAKGHVEELKDLSQDWKVNILSINQDINDQEFVVVK